MYINPEIIPRLEPLTQFQTLKLHNKDYNASDDILRNLSL